VMTRWALVLLVAAACTGGSDHESRLPQCVGCTGARDAAASGSLCSLCTADSDCESGTCKPYGDGYRKCSLTCTAWEPAAQCTVPSPGSCNGMGHCMCPPMEAPQDAGSPLDAPTVP